MSPPPAWKWTVCGLLLLATMFNYMDRQTLAQLAHTIRTEHGLTHAQYGDFEFGFGLAFAAGSIAFGLVVDRVGVRWLYPAVLLGWSLAGILTAFANDVGAALADAVPALVGTAADSAEGASDRAYLGFLACRVVLGFFEAGHWPCALVTTRLILERHDRSFGNSLLQSGASLGAVLTPLIIAGLAEAGVLDWRVPFVVIGGVGLLWIVPWLAVVRGHPLAPGPDSGEAGPPEGDRGAATPAGWVRRFLALAVIVVTINITWQFFRAWMPMFLQEKHGFSLRQVGLFSAAYYVATDVGCIGVGVLVKRLAGLGWDVHRARVWTFTLCTAVTLLSVAVALDPPGPVLLALLLLVGAGALGLFPNYYAFSQELSTARTGTVTGMLAALAWVGSALMQKYVGHSISATESYATGIVLAGLAPVLAWLALVLLWRPLRSTDGG